MKFKKYNKLVAIIALVIIFSMVIGSVAGSLFSVM